MTDNDSDALNRLLRGELTAVNQQFSHILILRTLGHGADADRIAEIDGVDFPNAMCIADLLIRTGAAISISSEAPLLGAGRNTILAVEYAFERHLEGLIEPLTVNDPEAARLIATARTPRPAYRDWLAATFGTEAPEPIRPVADPLYGFLIVWGEQTLLHALLHHHRGTPQDAAAAWLSSGVAMMFATRLVTMYAKRGQAPAATDMASLTIAGTPDDAWAADRALSAWGGDQARTALANCADETLAELYGKIAERARELARLAPGEPHPASGTLPGTFEDFPGMYERYIARRQEEAAP